MNLLEIFKAGTWTDVSGQELSFSVPDVAAIAAAYDPAVFKAPLVVGHPKTNDPAYGWVSRLQADGEILLADRDQVEPAFAEMVNAGRFPKISASFFPPSSPANPKPGTWYLRHVGFLGAAAPAVPGLKPASFAGDQGDVVTIEFAGSAPVATFKPKEPLVKPKEPPTADFAAQQAELDRKAAALETREKALQDKEAANRNADITAFAEQLEKDGKILPRERAGLVAFMASLDDSGTVSFAAEGGTVNQPGCKWLREFLTGLPERVDFSERAGAERDQAEGNTVGFAAPNGFTADRDRLALHNRIVAHQKQHNVDYATAAAAVGA